MNASGHESLGRAASTLLTSARFGQALTVASIATAFLSFVLRQTIGWPGLIAVVSTLVVLAGAVLTLKRHELEWRGILPISLLVFMGWTAISVFWSYYGWATLGSVLYQIAFAALGVSIAVTRDLIQVVRGFGDALRLLLGVSVGLEVLSGLIIDLPITFLDIRGDLAFGGPIQGLFGSRNQLGLVALVALITFYVELQTRSIRKSIAMGSLIGAGTILLLSRSPVSFGAFVAVVAAAVALIALRRTEAHRRRMLQIVLLIALVIGSVILFLGRSQVISLLNAGSESGVRFALWRSIFTFTSFARLEGFGWLGQWRDNLPPYYALGDYSSALNAFIDVMLQVGIVGLFSFLALVGLTLVRSWLVASNKRSVVHLWPALCVVTLLVSSLAESSVLVEFGWLTLVVCTLKASQNLSWRTRLGER